MDAQPEAENPRQRASPTAVIRFFTQTPPFLNAKIESLQAKNSV